MKLHYPTSASVFGILMSVILLFATACGGGGGGSTPAPTPTPVPTPTNYAPETLTSKSLTLTDPDITSVTTTYTFTATTYTAKADSGTYTYARSSVLHQANLKLVSSYIPARNLVLTFQSATNGLYLDSDTNKTGTFTIQ